MKVRISVLILLLIGCAEFPGQSNGKTEGELAPQTNVSKQALDAEVTQVQLAAQFKSEFTRTRARAIDKNTKEISSSEQAELDAIVEKMEEEVPTSAEYHYVKYVNSNYDVSQVDHLHKAYELSNNKTEFYDDYIAYYELTQDESKKAEFCTKLYNSKTVPRGVMDYNYNVLMSLDEHAILFVNGSDDTYPIWLHQQVKGVRKDVTILNVDLLGVKSYRDAQMKKLGVTSKTDFDKDRVGFIKSIAKENPGKPIYFALTLSPQAIKGVKDHLYLTGLALKYSAEPIENIPVLKENWERRFRVSSLDDIHTNSTVKEMNNNYILPIMLLSMNYRSAGDTQQATRLQNLALKLAKEGGKETQVKQYIQKQ